MTRFTQKEAESLRDVVCLIQKQTSRIDDLRTELMDTLHTLESLLDRGGWGWFFNDSTGKLEFKEYPEQNAS